MGADAETGLDYFRGRHYAPAFGLFMQPGPGGELCSGSGGFGVAPSSLNVGSGFIPICCE
jgi:hypothetical protein